MCRGRVAASEHALRFRWAPGRRCRGSSTAGSMAG